MSRVSATAPAVRSAPTCCSATSASCGLRCRAARPLRWLRVRLRPAARHPQRLRGLRRRAARPLCGLRVPLRLFIRLFGGADMRQNACRIVCNRTTVHLSCGTTDAADVRRRCHHTLRPIHVLAAYVLVDVGAVRVLGRRRANLSVQFVGAPTGACGPSHSQLR